MTGIHAGAYGKRQMSKRLTKLTAEEAEMLIEHHDLDEILQEGEERELLEANNPELLAVYDKLQKIAEGN